jgi:hypothetical protein
VGRTSTAVGEDHDISGGARGGKACVWCEPQQQMHGWCGPRRWRRHGVEAHGEEERSVRRQRGGGRRSVEADMEEEQTPTGVWRGNDSSQG